MRAHRPEFRYEGRVFRVPFFIEQKQFDERIRLVENRGQAPALGLIRRSDRYDEGHDAVSVGGPAGTEPRTARQRKPALEEDNQGDERRDPADDEENILEKSSGHISFLNRVAWGVNLLEADTPKRMSEDVEITELLNHRILHPKIVGFRHNLFNQSGNSEIKLSNDSRFPIHPYR
jgi:hypothetical protein